MSKTGSYIKTLLWRESHCSKVTTSTACPSTVTVESDILAVTGAMATCTGPLPCVRLVTTVWYMLTGICTSPVRQKIKSKEGLVTLLK